MADLVLGEAFARLRSCDSCNGTVTGMIYRIHRLANLRHSIRYNDCLGESRLASRWAWDGSGSGSSRAPLLESEAEREPDRLRRFPLSRVYISS